MIERIERLRVGPIGENTYAIQSGTTGFLVDPGDEAEAILAFLEERNYRITLIALTHGHLDHCAAIPGLMAAWADAPPALAIHSGDAHYLGARGESTNRILFESIRAPSFFSNYWKALPEPTLLLNDGDTLPGTGFKVLHTPGHSAGSVCFYDQESGILISGDTLFRDGVGRTDAPDSDFRLLDESLRKLEILPPDTVVYPGHGPKTTIGRELSAHARFS